MRTYLIDCGKVGSEADFWQTYVAAVAPQNGDLFGRNLDAFWDALNGGPGWPGECEVRFVNTNSIRTLRAGSFYGALQRIAQDSQQVQIYVE